MKDIHHVGAIPKLSTDEISLVRLNELIETYQPEFLKSLLTSFHCERNKDVEEFLHADAIVFERAGKSRTYLVVTTTSLKDNTSPALDIIGYFTLALTELQLGDSISKTRRKKLHGLFQPDSDLVVGYLIGQLAKCDLYQKRIAGNLLIEIALDIIREAQLRVGGRFVIVECVPEEKLLLFYQTNGFIFLQNDPTDEMAQLAYFL